LIRIAAPALPANAAKEETFVRSPLLANPAYELSVELRPTPHGHHLRFISFVPIARSAREQVRFETLLDAAALQALRRAIDAALAEPTPHGLTS
jgi:hypothetical protein